MSNLEPEQGGRAHSSRAPSAYDDGDDGDDVNVDANADANPYASANRWRHQESSAFARHAARTAAPVGGTSDLADFFNKSRIEPAPSGSRDGTGAANFTPLHVAAVGSSAQGEGEETTTSTTHPSDGKEIVCGPLLNYRHMAGNRWHGSVLVVVRGGGGRLSFAPTLDLRPAGAHARPHAQDAAANEDEDDGHGLAQPAVIQGACLYSDPRNTFWQFDISVDMHQTESAAWEYVLPQLRYASPDKPQRSRFWVPAVSESMRIMFHSCNGFSVGTDEEAWSGPVLWNDVMRRHAEAPIHVMIGGGDQIYNDGIRVGGPLRRWAAIKSPRKRTEYPFPETLRRECDDYYLKNYIRWFNTGAFAAANGQIAQLNIWDDHDIIDGFGSYVDSFMKCDVFRGIGGTAHKYYLLFQHHLPPPPSTYTSDVPATMAEHGQGTDPNQLMDTFVASARADIPTYIIGQAPGPYVAEHSRSMYARLGARIAFLGIDARTERTRHQVNYPETYDLIFDRLRRELRGAADSGTPIKHLILLLGIPIAYPRLTWLENVLRSPVIGPIKFLHRRFGVGGGLFNHFDGSIDLLDDLDDHYTARTHKPERRLLVEKLQEIAGQYSIRVTILGGDVHLAALGRFYTNLKLKIPAEHDHRYMVNVVSSAITNKPPPQAIANLLARRNKIHHLDKHTDETLLDLFDKDPGDSAKTAKGNHCTMPSRNYALITENSPNRYHGAAANGHGHGHPGVGPANGQAESQVEAAQAQEPASDEKLFPGKDGHAPLHAGEVGSGTGHRAASLESHGSGNDGSLDVCIRVEINQHDREGTTQGYGVTVPTLESKTGLVVPSTATVAGGGGAASAPPTHAPAADALPLPP